MDGGGGRVVSLRAVESGLVTRLLAASTARLGAANAVRSGAWGPVDVTYLRADRGTGGRIQSAEFGQSDQPARGASGRGQRGADDFDEIYSVDLGTHTVLAARRTAHEDFSVFASSKAAAAALVEAGGFRVRATASVEGGVYTVGDYTVRLGTFRHAGTAKALVAAARFEPLHASHPSARDAEYKFLEKCFGGDVRRHEPP